ncbi:hypothetical protein ABZT08_09530 [Streptomyces sp. NPDC005526]|uniref:hypothetical protein n=1 Tax=Streptomyces sp. NPDC005526 TaxID=3156885 RepID=UPI0033B38762
MRETAALEAALAAALRGADPAPAAEQRAVAAYRSARGTGAHGARTRRRDDWRHPAERRSGRPMKTTFGVVFASLALGGVAVAAIGSAGPSGDGADAGPGAAHPSAAASDRPGGAVSSSSGDRGPTGRPASAQDTEAHCRAYEKVEDHGKALDAAAWRQLVEAAGGKDRVSAYCLEQLAHATAAPTGPGGTGRPAGGATAAGRATAGNPGASGGDASGNGTSGGASGGSGDTAGGGPTGGDRSGGGSGGGGSHR